VEDAIRTIGVTEVTYYLWKQVYGDLKTGQVRCLKHLEQENAPVHVGADLFPACADHSFEIG